MCVLIAAQDCNGFHIRSRKKLQSMALLIESKSTPYRLAVVADVASVVSVPDSALGASAVIPQKTASSHPVGAVPTLSTDEIAQLIQELEVLKEQPRAQMVLFLHTLSTTLWRDSTTMCPHFRCAP